MENPPLCVRRRVLLGLPLMGVLSAGRTHAQGAWMPARPVTIVSPFPPGNISDHVARAVQQKLAASLGQAVVVEYKPGAGSVLAFGHVARSAADGSTILLGSSTGFTISPHLQAKLPYEPFRDFVPLASVLAVPSLLVALPKLPARDLSELIDLARRKPGALSYASYGVGTSPHLIIEQLKHAVKIDLLHVPYKGGTASMQALLAGEVDVSFESLSSALPRIQSGQVKALAVMQPERTALLPDLMSIGDAGYPGVGFPPWLGLFAPAGTPAHIVQALSKGIRAAVNDPENRARFTQLGTEPMDLEPAVFAQFLRRESDQMAAIIKAANIRVD